MRKSRKDAEIMLKRLWYMEKLGADEEEISQLHLVVRNLVDNIPNETLRKVAEARYLDCLTWKEVEKKLNYSKASLNRYNKIILDCVACQMW